MSKTITRRAVPADFDPAAWLEKAESTFNYRINAVVAADGTSRGIVTWNPCVNELPNVDGTVALWRELRPDDAGRREANSRALCEHLIAIGRIERGPLS